MSATGLDPARSSRGQAANAEAHRGGRSAPRPAEARGRAGASRLKSVIHGLMCRHTLSKRPRLRDLSSTPSPLSVCSSPSFGSPGASARRSSASSASAPCGSLGPAAAKAATSTALPSSRSAPSRGVGARSGTPGAAAGGRPRFRGASSAVGAAKPALTPLPSDRLDRLAPPPIAARRSRSPYSLRPHPRADARASMPAIPPVRKGIPAASLRSPPARSASRHTVAFQCSFG
jgi:hypothetical protein